MAKKHVFYYEGKTGIAEIKGFKEKGLAELSCNIGNSCEFGCAFCYVPAIANKQKTFQQVIAKGYDVDDFSLYRTRDNVLDCVKNSLKRIKPDDTRTVFFCTTCDPCSNTDHTETTRQAIELIMERSSLQARVLSKSKLIVDLAHDLGNWCDRVVFGLSTGTSRPEVSDAIEGNASPIGDRVGALRHLQDEGFRVFGMICPVLPREINDVKQLIDQVRPEMCEHVWAEAVNVRGKSLAKTKAALVKSGLFEDANMLEGIMANKESWREYAVNLFKSFQKEMKDQGVLHKLRYLQYVTREPEGFNSFFRRQPGAICL